jgi:hypothetical protein
LDLALWSSHGAWRWLHRSFGDRGIGADEKGGPFRTAPRQDPNPGLYVGKVVLLPGGARRRSGSPCGGSILITSAPALAISRVAYGP